MLKFIFVVEKISVGFKMKIFGSANRSSLVHVAFFFTLHGGNGIEVIIGRDPILSVRVGRLVLCYS